MSEGDELGRIEYGSKGEMRYDFGGNNGAADEVIEAVDLPDFFSDKVFSVLLRGFVDSSESVVAGARLFPEASRSTRAGIFDNLVSFAANVADSKVEVFRGTSFSSFAWRASSVGSGLDSTGSAGSGFDFPIVLVRTIGFVSFAALLERVLMPPDIVFDLGNAALDSVAAPRVELLLRLRTLADLTGRSFKYSREYGGISSSVPLLAVAGFGRSTCRENARVGNAC